MEGRQQILARWITGGTSPYIVAPGSGATITIYDSGADEATQQLQVTSGTKGVRFKRLIMSSTSSHDSGANGVVLQASFDNGTNWDTVVSYTDTAAGAPNIHYMSVAFPRWRIRYTNSANVLTTWRGSLIGDEYERASQ